MEFFFTPRTITIHLIMELEFLNLIWTPETIALRTFQRYVLIAAICSTK